MTFGPTFDDGRGRYPDRISAPAPRGMRDEIRRVACTVGMTSSAFIREAVESRLAALTASIAAEQGGHRD